MSRADLLSRFTNDSDERVRVGEKEKKWELWVARLLLSYLQHYVFYTSLAGLCDDAPQARQHAQICT